MKKEQVVYKVVSVVRGHYLSAFHENYWNYFLEYIMDQETIPVFGKIFVFKSLNFAQDFLAMKKKSGALDANSIILKGTALGIGRPKYICGRIWRNEEFWVMKKKKVKLEYGMQLLSAPVGTLTCDSFTPRVIEFVCP